MASPGGRPSGRASSGADGRAAAAAGHRCAAAQPQPTGIGELDRVLGGGIVAGSVTLLGGEPGIGKSTLLLQLLAWWPGPTLYVSAEESPQQVRLRAERLGAVRPDLWLAAETSLAGVVARDRAHAARRSSSSTASRPSPTTALTSSAGSVAQVRACAQQLVVEAKRRDVAVVLVGHVTKDGALAGPRVLEHVVDTVLSFEGERHHALRLLRAVKHRFGVDRRARPVRDDRPGSDRRPRSVDAAAGRPSQRRARVGRRAGDGRTPAAARRGPGADRADPVGHARPVATRRGSTAAGSPCCSRCSSGAPACGVEPGRLRLGRRRRAARRARHRPRRWRWPWPAR